MKLAQLVGAGSIAIATTVSIGFCQEATLTAIEIMQRVDDVLYAPKDKQLQMKFVLIDKSGKESVRELSAMEKGADRRLMKFIAPADQKGIAFLSLPNDVMYLYLPAFGKTRRIASHVKNTKFAGTDLTYENLEAKRFSPEWDPKLLGSDGEFYSIEQTPKPNKITEYSKLRVTVRKDNFYPVKVEYYDKAGNLYKIMSRNKVEKVGEKYWDSRESIMEDLKAQHKTKLIIVEEKFDTGISDDAFTERAMMQ
jgi:outer membrane lipoprotein-sorting protein